MKVKSNEKHKEGLEKLVCIEADRKTDKETLVYWEFKDENEETKLKKGQKQEYHLTFTKELRTDSGTYLSELSRLKVWLVFHLVMKLFSVLKEFISMFIPWKLTQTLAGWETL